MGNNYKSKEEGRYSVRIKAELLFPGKLKDEPIICNLCKKFDIIVSVVEASFSTETGWAILVFEGSEEEIKKAFEYLKDKDIEIKDPLVNP